MNSIVRSSMSAVYALLITACVQSTDEPPRGGAGAAAAANPAATFDTVTTGDSVTARRVVRIDSLPASEPPIIRPRSLVVFADSSSLEVPIRDARLLLTLPVEDRAPWLLLAGVDCTECDAPMSVWVFRAVPGRNTARALSYTYPGAHSEAGIETSPYWRSRLFVGRCTPAPEPVALWLEEVLKPDSARTRRARILSAAPTLADRIITWDEALERDVFARKSTGACREVDPVDQYIL